MGVSIQRLMTWVLLLLGAGFLFANVRMLIEYTRFLMMQLRKGVDGSTRMLSEALIVQQRTDGFGPTTTIVYTPYVLTGRVNHYGFGGWVEAANGADAIGGYR